jgi:hypothetical protein
MSFSAQPTTACSSSGPCSTDAPGSSLLVTSFWSEGRPELDGYRLHRHLGEIFRRCINPAETFEEVRGWVEGKGVCSMYEVQGKTPWDEDYWECVKERVEVLERDKAEDVS